MRAVLVVLHVRRRRVRRRRRGAGRRSRARAAAAAQFRQSPVGGREFGSQVGHLLAGRLDRPIDAERELLIVFHHAQDFGLGAREVTKSCMMRGGRVAGHPRLYLLGPPRPGSPAPRPPGTGSAGSSGAGMTAAPPAGAAAVARRRGGGGGKRKRRRRRRRSSDRRDPGAERGSGKDTARRPVLFHWSLPFAARSGGGPAPGARRTLSLPRPPLRGHTPPGRRGRRAAAASGPRWRPRREVGGACSTAGPRSPPRSGGAAPAPASRLPARGRAGKGVGARERGVLGKEAQKGSRDGARGGEGAAGSISGVELCLP